MTAQSGTGLKVVVVDKVTVVVVEDDPIVVVLVDDFMVVVEVDLIVVVDVVGIISHVSVASLQDYPAVQGSPECSEQLPELQKSEPLQNTPSLHGR